MAQSPTLTDYVDVIMGLFTRFEQDRTENEVLKLGRSFAYSERAFIVFFIMMQNSRISNFKAQRRWLNAHPEAAKALGWERAPHRTTISRRFSDLCDTVESFIVFVARTVSERSGESDRFDLSRLVEDKSLFRARGPVWHQKHRKEGIAPDNPRDVDTDATWSKSSYRGWVYGYAIHMTCNEDGFSVMVNVETASVSESAAFDRKERDILNLLNPKTLTADDAYTKAMRVRRWFKRGAALITPALKWKKGRYAQAHQEFIGLPESMERFGRRRTSVEPLFDLIGKAAGTDAGYRELPVKRIDNVRSFLMLGALSVQIAMVVNQMWGAPPRHLHHDRRIEVNIMHTPQLNGSGAYFLSRLKAGVNLYRQDGSKLDVSELLADPVSADVAAQRRLRLKDQARKKGRAVSAEGLRRCGWTLLITNAPENLMSLDDALTLARVRWQIELLFNLWKQHGGVERWRSEKRWRILCEVYAKLIAMVIMRWTMLAGCWADPRRSLVKAASVVRGCAKMLACSMSGLFISTGKALEQIALCMGAGNRIQNRRRNPSAPQLLFALDGFDGSP